MPLAELNHTDDQTIFHLILGRATTTNVPGRFVKAPIIQNATTMGNPNVIQNIDHTISFKERRMPPSERLINL